MELETKKKKKNKRKSTELNTEDCDIKKRKTMDSDCEAETDGTKNHKRKKKKEKHISATETQEETDLQEEKRKKTKQNSKRKQKEKTKQLDTQVSEGKNNEESGCVVTVMKTKSTMDTNSIYLDTEHKLTKKLEKVTGETFSNKNKHKHSIEVEEEQTPKKKKNIYKMEEVAELPNDTDEDVDPEKAAIRKKKREKRREKKLNKLKAKQEALDKAGTAKVSATEYLKQWNTDRDNWKFQKVRQVWLLKNMFNESLVTDEMFEILLHYIEPLKGKSKEATVKAAEKIMEDLENEETTNDAVKEERAKSVIQLLS